MKSIKYTIVLLVIIVFCFQLASEERKKPIPMKELTDPKSRSYVPYPYPKNRAEIIADFKYYCKKFCSDKNDYKGSFACGDVNITDKISLNLLEPHPDYQIGEIFKVKNRISRFADDYIWLILVMNRNGQVSMRVSLHESGLVIGAGAIGKRDMTTASPEEYQLFTMLMKVFTEEDVKNALSDSIGRTFTGNEIKKMERVAYYGPLGDFSIPVWEITMADGTIYYYSELQDMIFSIDKKIPWKKDNQGIRPLESSLTQSWDYLPDTINDELIILNRIPRK